jgi:hypothetical protein
MTQKFTPDEYDKYMVERNQKLVQNKSKNEFGFLIGSPNDVKFSTPNVVVYCEFCNNLLYIRPANKELAEKNNLMIICFQCAVKINPAMVKGAFIQANAAASHKFGGTI